MTVQRGISEVDVVILAEIRHQVVGDKIQQLTAIDDKILIAHFLVGVCEIVVVIKADKYHRCSFAVLHAFSQFGTVAEAPYTVCQEEYWIGLVLVVIRRERNVYSKTFAHFFVVDVYFVNGILYFFNGSTVKFPVASVILKDVHEIWVFTII